MSIEQQHAAFEALARDNGLPLTMYLDGRGYSNERTKAAWLVYQAAIELDRQGRGEPGGRNARDAIHGLQGSIAVGSDGEWVSIRRDARDAAIQRLRELSDDCAHMYESYRLASDRADRSSWPTDAMVVLGAEVLHDGLRSLGVGLDEDFRGTTLEQGIAESVFSSMMDLAPQPDEPSRGEPLPWHEAICHAKNDALHVFAGSCNHTEQAIEYMAVVLGKIPTEQPADPTIKESLTVAEPVKVPSDADLFAIHDEHYPTMLLGHDKYLNFARALLASYGKDAQQSVPDHLIKRLLKHAENKENTAFARSSMREAVQYLTTPSAAGQARQAKTGKPVMHANQVLTAQQDADKVDAERPEWTTCESRRPFVVNSLKAVAADMRSAERRCRNAYRKDYMSLPTKYIADSYGEAAAIFESRLCAIGAAMQQESPT